MVYFASTFYKLIIYGTKCRLMIEYTFFRLLKAGLIETEGNNIDERQQYRGLQNFR